MTSDTPSLTFWAIFVVAFVLLAAVGAALHAQWQDQRQPAGRHRPDTVERVESHYWPLPTPAPADWLYRYLADHHERTHSGHHQFATA